ncbi:hypothetical protein ACH4OW_31745 [Streptomyces sp. NPDC017056]|uniref:hypothetical protein n=1 Tax=Streptomyces sp. NPDC017056 TaxID=3364973 RepID=UPI0037A5C9ED
MEARVDQQLLVCCGRLTARFVKRPVEHTLADVNGSLRPVGSPAGSPRYGRHESHEPDEHLADRLATGGRLHLDDLSRVISKQTRVADFDRGSNVGERRQGPEQLGDERHRIGWRQIGHAGSGSVQVRHDDKRRPLVAGDPVQQTVRGSGP